MPGETQTQPNTPEQTKWDSLSQEVPFQGDNLEKTENSTDASPDQKHSRNIGEMFRKMYHEVDLTTDEFTERFRESKVYEDTAKYHAKPITKIFYTDELFGDKTRTMEIAGWVDDLTTVQPYKRNRSQKYPPEIEAIMVPSSDRECKVTKIQKLYNIDSEGYSEHGITPEEFVQQYTENEDGTFHNTELLRIIKAKPEEQFDMDKETLELADKTEHESGVIYALPMTEYFTAPVDLNNPDVIPSIGRRAVMDIRPGYGIVE